MLFREADRRLCALLPEGATYHRIVDDLVISTNCSADVPRLAVFLEQAIEAVGLSINETKKKRFGLQSRVRSQIVHGVQVNDARTLHPDPAQVKAYLKEAEALVRGARAVSHTSIAAVARRRLRIEGFVAYLGQFPRQHRRHLCRLTSHADRLVKRRLCRLGVAIPSQGWYRRARSRDMHWANHPLAMPLQHALTGSTVTGEPPF
jgi:hypothetical protein